MKKGLFALSLLGTLGFANAQHIVTGTVLDEDGKKLSNVQINDPLSKRWTQTDSNGFFTIELINENSNLTFSQIGKESQDVLVDSKQTNINIVLYNQTLRLEQVDVFPKKKKEFSEIILGKEAIENVQAFSINDVLQQLPGQFTPELNNNQFKNIVFRSAINNASVGKISNLTQDRQDYFANRAFGTSVVVNDIPLSNNENMQTFSPNTSSAFGYNSGNVFGDGSNNTFSNANYGFDLREVATNNIEDIKVIQGIASAKYGDMTSGLILVQTKVGETPYNASISMRDATTEYNLSKGFRINSRNFFNAQANFLESNSDPRNSLTKYSRFNGNLSWKTNNKSSSLTNTLAVNFSLRKDQLKSNPDDFTDAKIKDDSKSFRISDNFKWNLKKSWIDSFTIDANFSYAKSNSYKEEWRNTGIAAVTDATESGIHDAIIVPSQYFYNMNVEGIPISTYLNLEGTKSITTKKGWSHTFSGGLSSRTSANLGKGRYTVDDAVPNYLTLSGSGGSLGYRDYNFRNSKTVLQFSAYAEDQITKYFDGDAVYKLNAGLRYENQLGYSTLQPRINTSYAFNKVIRIRGGYGLASKTPSLNQLYTGDRFYDYLLGSGIYSTANSGYRAWIQSFKLDGDNSNLKPIKSMNSELGLDLNFRFGSLGLTGFYNKMTDGITTVSDPFTRRASLIELNNTTNPASYTIVGEKNIYFFANRLENNLTSEDKGIEAFLTFNRIKPLNLDIQLNTSYVTTRNKTDSKQYTYTSLASAEEQYGVYNSLNTKTEQLTFGSNFNYHLKSVGLILNLRTEHIFVMNHNRNQVRNPIGYLDKNMVYHDIPVADQANMDKYSHLIKTPITGDEKLQNTLHNVHLRISKDFLNGFKVSVYTTNILGLKPTYIDSLNEKKIYPIAEFSLGGKLEYSF